MTHDHADSPAHGNLSPSVPADWRRPPGVASGTWQYVHQGTIARHYDAFVADTPLCELDVSYTLAFLAEHKPGPMATKPEQSLPTMLDLGAGTGRLAFPAANCGWKILAIDLSQSMLAEIQTKREAIINESGPVLPLRANLVQLDGLRDNIADEAICMFSTLGMIQGTTHRAEFLAHVARAVKPGGRLLLHVHRRWAALREPGGWRALLKSRWNAWRLSDCEFGDATYRYRGLADMFMHRFTTRELRALLATAGWQVNQIERVSLDGKSITESTWNSSGFFVTCSHREN